MTENENDGALSPVQLMRQSLNAVELDGLKQAVTELITGIFDDESVTDSDDVLTAMLYLSAISKRQRGELL